MQGVFSQHPLRSITPPLFEPPPPFTLNLAYTIQLGHTQLLLLLLLLLQHYQPCGVGPNEMSYIWKSFGECPQGGRLF